MSEPEPKDAMIMKREYSARIELFERSKDKKKREMIFTQLTILHMKADKILEMLEEEKNKPRGPGFD